MIERGVIRNEKRARQLRNVSGLRYAGNITPADIDAIIDFGGRAFPIVELKLEGYELSVGQRRLIEAQVSRLIKGGAAAIGIFAWHDAFDPAVAIDVANAKVQETYDGNLWVGFKGLITVRYQIDWFLRSNGLEHYIE